MKQRRFKIQTSYTPHDYDFPSYVNTVTGLDRSEVEQNIRLEVVECILRLPRDIDLDLSCLDVVIKEY